MPCSSILAAAICSASAIGASAPASRICVSMSRACASRRLTSLLAFAGGMSFIRELISTGNGSESAKCSQGSPSGNDIKSGKRANEMKAAYDSPDICSRHSRVRPLWICPSKRVSISPTPHRRRLVADGNGSPAVCMSVCWTSQPISPDVACLAASALAFSARPSRSAESVHLVISAGPTASSSRPSPFSPRE